MVVIYMAKIKCFSCGTDVTGKRRVGFKESIYCVPCYEQNFGPVANIGTRVPAQVTKLKNPCKEQNISLKAKLEDLRCEVDSIPQDTICRFARDCGVTEQEVVRVAKKVGFKSCKSDGFEFDFKEQNPPMPERKISKVKKLHPKFGQIRKQYLKPEELVMRQQLGPMEQNPKSAKIVIEDAESYSSLADYYITGGELDFASNNIEKAAALMGVLTKNDQAVFSYKFDHIWNRIEAIRQRIRDIKEQQSGYGLVPHEQNPDINLTPEQQYSRGMVIRQHDGREPNKEWYDGIQDVYFMQYGPLMIGIETDGYAHTEQEENPRRTRRTPAEIICEWCGHSKAEHSDYEGEVLCDTCGTLCTSPGFKLRAYGLEEENPLTKKETKMVNQWADESFHKAGQTNVPYQSGYYEGRGQGYKGVATEFGKMNEQNPKRKPHGPWPAGAEPLAEIRCPNCGGFWHDPKNNFSREQLCRKCFEKLAKKPTSELYRELGREAQKFDPKLTEFRLEGQGTCPSTKRKRKCVLDAGHKHMHQSADGKRWRNVTERNPLPVVAAMIGADVGRKVIKKILRNPMTKTGLYYPKKGSQEARDKMARLRAMRKK